MKRILFVINTMGLGGAERAMLSLMRALPREEVELSLYALVGRGELFRQVPDNVRILNENPSPGSVLDAEGRQALRRASIKALLRREGFGARVGYLSGNFLRQAVKGRIRPDKLLWRPLADAAPVFPGEYDLAVAFLEGGATYYAARHVNARAKAAFVHIDYVDAGYTRELDGDCYEHIDRVYAVADGVRERFLSVHPECGGKVRVFHNIVDTARLQALSREPGGFADGYGGRRILTIGRLHPQKGYDVAIAAMRILVDRGCEARWYAMGEGPERAHLEKLIAQNHLEDRFILLGARENPYPFIRQADLYVHATRFEGKPIALEEARALGKPIVASDCAGNREQVREGIDGLLTPLNARAVADAVARLLSDPALANRMAEAARLRDTGGEEDVRALLKMAEARERA